MVKLIIIFTNIVLISGCSTMEPSDPLPVRPIISCEDCSGLIYYGPQQEPAPDPRIQLASIIVRGLVSGAGIIG